MFCFWWFAIIGSSGTGVRVSISSSAVGPPPGVAWGGGAFGAGPASRRRHPKSARDTTQANAEGVIGRSFPGGRGGNENRHPAGGRTARERPDPPEQALHEPA